MFRALAVVLLVCGLALASAAQDLSRFRMGTADGYCEGSTTEQPTAHLDPAREYHWLKGQAVQVTQGGYSGRLLHGAFTAYYPGGQLREKGRYDHGVKNGAWRSWRADGTLATIAQWRAGLLQGRSTHFDSTGHPLRTEHYRRGMLKRTEVVQAKAAREKKPLFRLWTKHEDPAEEKHRRTKHSKEGLAPDTIPPEQDRAGERKEARQATAREKKAVKDRAARSGKGTNEECEPAAKKKDRSTEEGTPKERAKTKAKKKDPAPSQEKKKDKKRPPPEAVPGPHP